MYGALIGAAIAAIGGLISQSQQSKHNRELAKTQADANEAYQNRQNQYNSPAAQMARFKEAGLSPQLMYGQGNPGNQSAPLSYPDIKPTDMGAAAKIGAEVLPLYNQTRLADSQVQAQNANTMAKTAQAEVSKIQAAVMRRNPLLNDGGYNAIIDGLKSSAMLKEQQNYGQQLSNMQTEAQMSIAIQKVYKEVELLEQRFKLGELDQKIKSQVLTSKEFQNAILEVQKKFMTDAEITPQHIWQFIQMLLMKSL